MTTRAHNPMARWTWCGACNGNGYLSRADARTVRKQLPGASWSITVCPHNDSVYHLQQRNARHPNCFGAKRSQPRGYQHLHCRRAG